MVLGTVELKRSTRLPKPKTFPRYFTYIVKSNENNKENPTTVKEALNRSLMIVKCGKR